MTSRTTPKQRIVLLISFMSFIGSGLIGLAKFNTQVSPPPSTATATSAEDSIREKIRGYEIVLEREPENQTALEGLTNARLEAKDPEGAVAPLEKLVKLYPDRADYAKQLAEIKR
jgi:cytochrome c-type biogenesis protein CcmH/NrfG